MKQIIFLGSDHAGFELKEDIKKFLDKNGYGYEDIGVKSREPSDYPQTAFAVAQKVVQTKSRGILMCGTGVGECIVANKVKGIRAANCANEYTARMSREHNDANVLCLGARVISSDNAQKILKIWLETPFSSDERHIRRIRQIEEIEQRVIK